VKCLLACTADLVLDGFKGASVRRVIDRSHACVPEHAHDWPVLWLFVIGSYLNQTEIEIEFDPTRLGRWLIPPVPVMLCIRGRAGIEARRLVQACEGEASEDRLRAALQRFLEGANRQPAREPAAWVDALTRRLREDTTLRVGDLATEVRRHPPWVGAAYRHATGEGLQETAARFRVERATRLLRETGQAYASIAFEAGFCDQSHMNRTFRACSVVLQPPSGKSSRVFDKS
jgi:AraC family transcriptional regulator